MSISLQNHENRIVTLEQKSRNFNQVVLLNTYNTMLAGATPLSFNVSQYLDWDWVYFRYDHWGGNHPEYDSTDAFLPVGLCKLKWCQITQLWESKINRTDGIQCYISGSTLQVKYAGGEGQSGLRMLGLLKLCYNFSYNIYTHRLFTPLKLF